MRPSPSRAAALLGLTIGLGAALTTGVHAETVTVSSVAIGRTEQQAVEAALVQAVEQATGVTVASSRLLEESYSKTAIGEQNASAVSEKFQQDLRQKSGGAIRSYRITAVEPRADGFVARLSVDVERFSAPGLPTSDRRRIVVAMPQDLTARGGDSVIALRDRVAAFLVQSRRFAVLDRVNEPLFRQELDVLSGPGVPAQEKVRIGQTIGADYIVLLKMNAYDTQSSTRTLRLTGRTVTSQVSTIAVDFSILDVATRQVKWTGRFADPQNADLTATLDVASAAIGENILDAIYPLLVLQTGEDGSIVVNQGGGTLRPGQVLSVNRLGDEMVDPYTKEPLGRAETPIGRMVIERVDPKLSYGRMVEGPPPAGTNGFVLRKIAAASSASQDEATPTPSHAAGSKPRW